MAESNPVSAFIEAASVPREGWHASGTLAEAEAILERNPQAAGASIYTAAILADEAAVRGFLERDAPAASRKGGPRQWDALTYLCFSRYLRLDTARAEAFVRTARALLEAGASANTGWYETIDHPNPRQALESAIYGAAGIAHHAELTRLLLEYGADPNDEETPYHAPEDHDLAVVRVLLESGRLNPASLCWMLVRKADWHDTGGLRLVLEHGADPNFMPRWGYTALHQALRRDNAPAAIELLLEHGADPALRNRHDGRSSVQLAADRGRGDVLDLFERRGIALDLRGEDRRIAECARGRRPEGEAPAESGARLAEFAGNGNVPGIRCLLELGVPADALYAGDPYWDVAPQSTALHVAAWRARHAVVKELIARGAPLDAVDGKGRTPLVLAVKACTESYWKDRRSTESIAALLEAGASTAGLRIPTGYGEADELLAG